MKYFTTVIAFLLTIGLVLIGAFLPNFIFSYQNHRIQSQVEQYSMEQIQCQYSSNLEDTLYLLSRSYYTMNYDSLNAHSTETEAYYSAMTFFKELSSYGFPFPSEDAIVGHKESFFWAVEDTSATSVESNLNQSTDSSTLYKSSNSTIIDNDTLVSSAALWRIEIIFENDLYIMLYLDDLTQKVVSFSLQSANLPIIESDKESSYFLDSMADFMQDYYDLELIDSIEDNYKEEHYQIIYIFSSSDSSKNLINIPLNIYLDDINFNNFYY